jgi:hypothetical protein
LKVGELLDALNKGYVIGFKTTFYEDQSLVKRERDLEVIAFQFIPDDGDGEEIYIWTKGETKCF